MIGHHKKNDSLALRKQLIQMRLELNRQKIRHEGIILLEPVEKLRDYKHRFMSGRTPMLAIAGVGLASFFLARKKRSIGSFLPVMRIAAGLLPLLLNHSTEQKTSQTRNPSTKP